MFLFMFALISVYLLLNTEQHSERNWGQHAGILGSDPSSPEGPVRVGAGHRGETEEDRELGQQTNTRNGAGNRCSETEKHRVRVSLTHWRPHSLPAGEAFLPYNFFHVICSQFWLM